MRLISVIIPSLNSPQIGDVARAVLQQSFDQSPIEVLIVGRDEQSLIPSDPRVRFIDTGVPVGPATARNIGIREARGDLLCFLDADCIASSRWLELLASAHARGHMVVGGGVRLERSSYWALCDDLLAFGPILSWTAHGERRALASLNLLIDRTALDRTGGFDETFRRPAGEDTDLSFRLRRAGYALMCEPHATVVHRHGRRSFRNMLRHLYQFGYAQTTLHQRYPEFFAQQSLRAYIVRVPRAVMLAAPVLATIDVVRLWLSGHVPRSYWWAVPGMACAKSAWYVGLAAALRHAARENRPLYAS